MSVLRSLNVLGQMRLDVPHLRSIESSIASDFDLLAGQILGANAALVIKGFDIITTGAIGNPASSLQLNVANGVLMHPLASDHGTIFSVAADAAVETLNTTNANVEGSFAAGQVNYVGLDLRRSADDSTADLVQFMDANTLIETPKSVPLARTLKYKIVISLTDFASTPYLLPVAKVTTNASNIVTALVDARQMMTRLGSGGSVPDIHHAYPWAAGRKENTSGAVFTGGDKQIGSLKEWMDATMTRVWEIGGGEYWYSPTADRNIIMIGSGTTFSNGEYFEWVSSNLHWRGLQIVFDNSTGYYNVIQDQLADSTGLTNLADGECIYIDLDRTANSTLVPARSTIASLGQSAIPGQRQIIAWRIGANVYTRGSRYAVGTTLTPATTTSIGVVKLSHTPTTPSQPIVYSDGAANAASGVVALDANKTTAWTSTTGTVINVTAGGGNGNGVGAAGNGTGAGVSGTGGTTSGTGLVGFGGAPNGIGITGTGSGTGAGISGGGGGTSGTGVAGTGGAPNGVGVAGNGTGTGAGVTGTGGATGHGVIGNGGSTGGNGVWGIGSGSAAFNGVVGQGGGGSGAGGYFTGGSTNGNGVTSQGTGSGAGVSGVGGATGVGGTFAGGATAGNGVQATGGGTSGVGGQFTGGSPNGTGVSGTGTGTGLGGSFTGGASGDGLHAIAGGGTGLSGIFGQGGPSGAGVWGKAGMASSATVAQNAIVADQGGIGFANVVNPNSNVGYTNALAAKSIVKAWASISTNGSGGASVNDGFNIASVSTSGGNVIVTLATAMASSVYAVVVTNSVGANAMEYQISSSTIFLIGMAGVNLSTSSATFSVIVMGAQ